MLYEVVLALLLAVTSVSSEPLLLSPLLSAGDVSQARNLSSVHLDWVYTGPSHAGFLTADEKLGNHLFFWFFPSTTNDNAPLVVWLNGGPGIPSMVGVFLENGPIDMSTYGTADTSYLPVISFTPRDFSWVGPFSMLYIDSPVGTGFSYSDSGADGLRRDRDGYTGDLYRVMVQFYQMFPEYHHRELYIGGQSYGGKFVPALANRVHQENRNGSVWLPLAGIYLGSPYFAPKEMANASQDFLFNLGFVSKAQVNDYKDRISNLFEKFAVGEVTSTRNIYRVVFGPYIGPINTYNFVLADEYYHIQLIFDLYYFMGNNISIQEGAHANRPGSLRNVLKNAYDVRAALNNDILVSTKDELKTILENYKVLVYNGDYDVIVNAPGIEAGLLATPWNGRADYAATKRLLWRSASGVKGFYSHTGSLCRVVVHGAGHWAPRDRPEVTLDMMKQFVTHGCVRDE